MAYGNLFFPPFLFLFFDTICFLFKHSKPWSIDRFALQHLTGEVPTWPAQVLPGDGSRKLWMCLMDLPSGYVKIAIENSHLYIYI